MKKSLVIFFLLLFVSGMIFGGFSQKPELPNAEYTVVDVVYVGWLVLASKVDRSNGQKMP
jgi:hypothetical protein